MDLFLKSNNPTPEGGEKRAASARAGRPGECPGISTAKVDRGKFRGLGAVRAPGGPKKGLIGNSLFK